MRANHGDLELAGLAELEFYAGRGWRAAGDTEPALEIPQTPLGVGGEGLIFLLGVTEMCRHHSSPLQSLIPPFQVGIFREGI